jgi:hypothetical protein
MDFSATVKHTQCAPGGAPIYLTRANGRWRISGTGAPARLTGRTWRHIRDLRSALRCAFNDK